MKTKEESESFARECMLMNKTKTITVNFMTYPPNTFQRINNLDDNGVYLGGQQ